MFGSVEIFRIDPNDESKLLWTESVVHPLFTGEFEPVSIVNREVLESLVLSFSARRCSRY